MKKTVFYDVDICNVITTENFIHSYHKVQNRKLMFVFIIIIRINIKYKVKSREEITITFTITITNIQFNLITLSSTHMYLRITVFSVIKVILNDIFI